MIQISLYSLRERWVSFLGTFVIIALGTTLVCAIALAQDAAGGKAGYSSVLTLLSMMMIVTMFVSVFVISSTFAFSVAQRQREFALLRTLGAAPRWVAFSVYAEALVLAVAAGAAGCLLGLPAADLLFSVMHSTGLVPGEPAVEYSAGAAAAAFGTAVIVAVAGVWSPARRIRGIRPIEALREASVDSRTMTPGRWVAGLVFAGLSLVAGWGMFAAEGGAITPITMGLGMSAILALAFLTPVVIPPLSAALTWPLSGLQGAGAMVVSAGMAASVRRTASLSAPVLLTVGLLGVATGLVGTTGTLGARETAEWTSAEVTVTATAGDGLSDEQVQKLRDVSGAQVAVVRRIEIDLGGGGGAGSGSESTGSGGEQGGAAAGDIPAGALDEEEMAEMEELEAPAEGAGGPTARPVRVVDPQEIKAAVDPPAADGDFADLGADGVAVDEASAAANGWSAGDRVGLEMPDGSTVQARVAAVLTTSATAQPVNYIAAPLVEGHADAPAPFAYVGARPGTEAAGLRAGLDSAVDTATARVDEVGTIEPGREENDRMVFAFGALLLGMALLCSCMAIANTLVMSTSDRVRDFTALRLAGATRGQVLALVAAEALAVVAIGAVLGVAVTVACIVPLGMALGSGAATALAILPWAALLGMAAVCAVIAVVSAVVPAALTMRESANA